MKAVTGIKCKSSIKVYLNLEVMKFLLYRFEDYSPRKKFVTKSSFRFKFHEPYITISESCKRYKNLKIVKKRRNIIIL